MSTLEFVATAGIAGAVGTILGIVSTVLLEWARWRREDRTRFRSDLYQRCVDLYVAAVLWQGRLQEQRPDLESWDVFDDMVTALSHIRMLAGGELADAATMLVQETVELDPSDDPENDESYEALEDLREAFNTAARKEIGVQVDPGVVRRLLAAKRQAGPELEG